MNCVKLVLSSLVLVVLAACGGKSNSDSTDSDATDAEFLKVSAELKETLPQLDESLSSQSPEGIWRVASNAVHSFSHEIYNEEIQEGSRFLDVDFESSSQLLVIIQKDYSAENTYIVYNCDGYRGAKSWALNGDTLSYKIINDSSEETGELVLDNNLSLVGRSSYENHDSNLDSTNNTIYTGVKISDSINFREAQDLTIDLHINQKDSSYQLSDNAINPSCFSISEDVGELTEYELTPNDGKTYSQRTLSFVLEMMSGDKFSAYEETIMFDGKIVADHSGYNSNVNGQNLQQFYCSEDWELSDSECLKSVDMTTSAEANAMSASSKGESLTGETFEIDFSYRKE